MRSTRVIDWDHPEVQALASRLAAESSEPVAVARRCFEWVRDEIRHSDDHDLLPLTCTASDVLRVGSGYCFAKSHLLAALLRANGIPAGFCYQRLSRDLDDAPFCLHGLNAVWLREFGWYRIDPRGNRADIDTRFDPPVERLAFKPGLPGEADLPEVWPDPLPEVVAALEGYDSVPELWPHLPDVCLWQKAQHDQDDNNPGV